MSMDNRRKKIIIGVCILTVIAVAVVLLMTCGVNGEKKAEAETETTTAEQEESTLGTLKETEKNTERGTDPAETKEAESFSYSRITVHPVSPQNTGNEDSRQSESTAQQETWEQQGQQETPVWQPVPEETAKPTEPASAAHVHSYVLAGTKTVEHPAVTEQVWVEDSPAWDETIRAGYHMCVVTCHECGAQFSDPAQANALEAWGEHTDAVHDGDGGYDMAASYDVPPEVVHHDASGHMETRTVTDSWTEYIDTYRCSCGDTYTQTR